MSDDTGNKTPTTLESKQTRRGVSRRDFIKYSAGAAAVAAGSSMLLGSVSSLSREIVRPNLWTEAPMAGVNVEELTIAQMQAMMAAGTLTAVALVKAYLARIQNLDSSGPALNSIMEVNPDALSIAAGLDMERSMGKVRGPLHGIPILLKDNIDTHDKMQTAAGSLGLVGKPALKDSTVASNLRDAGAVILGKTNLSEWANFRSFFSSSGWSGRAGQCLNPYFINLNPCGSSSGSGIAPSANLCAASIGTETDGSIVCPANNNGVVGIKPTVGLVSRAGVVPISHTQDTVGPHGRTVADAAAVLTGIVQRKPDPRDPATSANRDKIPADYAAFLDPNGLNGARIGVAREFEGFSPKTDVVFEAALTAIQGAGATLVDVSFPHFQDIFSGAAEFTVLLFDFKVDLQNYLATRSGVPLAHGTLADAIAFNTAHADTELRFFGQEIFELAQSFDVTDPNKPQAFGLSYNEAIAADRKFGATEGIDLLLSQNNLSAIVAPTDNPAWPIDLINGDHFVIGSSSPCAIVGYPIINVPAGNTFGIPLGISFMGTAFSEPTLIKLASGFEAVTHARQKPQFLPSVPMNNPTHTAQLSSTAKVPSAARRAIGRI